MRRFKSEFAHSYGTYSFGYTEYALREKGDSLSDLYDAGFLPYSGQKNAADMLYMARSARVRLADFVPSSENRRIFKRFDGMSQRAVTDFAHFKRSDDMLEFCFDYFSTRHGTTMPRERLETILNSGFVTDIVTYTADKDNKLLGYVFLGQDKHCSHFWFSFYDLTYIRRSLGLWLLLNEALEAKDARKKYFYIGTVYGEKGLYKTNFPALEYWDGNTWHDDVKKLRALCRADEKHDVRFHDQWKDEQPGLFF